MKNSAKKHVFVLMITLGIFLVVFLLVNFLNSRKIEGINHLQRQITVDLLATETQFALLKNTPCKTINNSILSQELSDMGEKLSFMESNQGSDDENVLQLKKYYSLLQVKDYLLMQEVAETCDIQTDSIVYFYEQDCADCVRQGHVLTRLKEKYPWLRIYSFDRNLDFSLIDTFEGLYELGDTYPVLIVGDMSYSGFKGVSDIESYIPELIVKKYNEFLTEEGLEYLLDLEDQFSGLEESNLVLEKIEGDVVYYNYVSSEDEDDALSGFVLRFDPEAESFSHEPIISQ